MTRFSPVLLAVILTACGTDVTGPSSSLLSCVFGEPATTAAGQVLQVRGAGNQGVCLDGGGDAEFVYVPFFASNDSAGPLSVSLTGAGFDGAASNATIGGTPAPVLGTRAAPPRYVAGHRFDDLLRRREIRELQPRIRSSVVERAPLEATVAADVPAVGDLRDFNTAISCDQVDMHTGRVMYVSQHAVIYADTTNPADLSSSDYAYFGVTFDTLVYPVETEAFGTPTDIDANGRSILFFTPAVNALNPAGSQTVTIGFFWSGDLFPATSTDRLEACPDSNHGEMFYLVAPDPNGQVGVKFTLEDVRRMAIPLIGHEFQHLVNASRRLFVNNAGTFEKSWLNEGLSHAAEELLFYEVAGMQPGQNITIEDIRNNPGPTDTIFNQYMGPNFNNYSKYLSRPDTASLMGPPNKLATRGAIWAFLRYAADRSGSQGFFYDVVNSQVAGLDNLNNVTGGAALDWMRDWTVSIYADDLVQGIEPRFTTRSWNWRSMYAGSTLEQYPLRVRTLVSGQTTRDELPTGGTMFNQFGVSQDGRAVMHVEANGGTPPGSLRGSFLRVR